MPHPSTFTTVPDAQARDIREQGASRKEWLAAIKAGKVIVMQTRPSLTKNDKLSLDNDGRRMRTRYTNANDENENEVYVWLEDVVQTPLPDISEAPVELPADDEVPL